MRSTAIPVDSLGNVSDPERIVVSESSIGANELVAADAAGRRIRVVAGLLSASGGANDVKFQSAATDITGVIGLPADGQLPIDPFLHGHFETAAGEALNLNLSAATAVGGWLVIVRVP
jgi:hypothetical protein